MTSPTSRRPRPLTFEDLLLLLLRRLLIPVALTEVLFGGLALLGAIVMGVPIFSVDPMLVVLLVPAAVVTAGLVFFGIPAGYAVARLGWSFARSVATLALIGFTAVELLQWAVVGYPSIVPGLFAALTAVIWARVNDDLFVDRRKPRPGSA